MGSALSSVPLCSRAEPPTDDNNNDHAAPDNNNAEVVVTAEPAPVQTSTPKTVTRDQARDLGDSEAVVDSMETYGSDSGLENSGDDEDLELSRYAVDEDYVDTVVDDDSDLDGDNDEETQESLESGDLGVDRATTFRVKKPSDEDSLEDKLARKLDDLEAGTDSVASRLTQLDISRDLELQRS